MSYIESSPMGFRLIGLSILACLLALLLAAPAHAQTSSDAQYGSPTAAGVAAIQESVLPPASGASDSGAASVVPASVASASVAPSSGGAALVVLPETGGSYLVPFALGILALGATAMLALKRASR